MVVQVGRLVFLCLFLFKLFLEILIPTHPSLSRTSLRKAQLFDLCPMTNLFFKETVEVVKEIAPRWCTRDMHTIMRRLREAYQLKKPPCFMIREGTPDDMQSMLHAWQHNPEGVPTAI